MQTTLHSLVPLAVAIAAIVVLVLLAAVFDPLRPRGRGELSRDHYQILRVEQELYTPRQESGAPDEREVPDTPPEWEHPQDFFYPEPGFRFPEQFREPPVYPRDPTRPRGSDY